MRGLRQWHWHRFFHESGLKAIHWYAVLPGADLNGEELVGLPDDLIRAVIWSLERSLFKFSSYEDKFCIVQGRWYIGPAAIMMAGRDGTEVPYAFA